MESLYIWWKHLAISYMYVFQTYSKPITIRKRMLILKLILSPSSEIPGGFFLLRLGFLLSVLPISEKWSGKLNSLCLRDMFHQFHVAITTSSPNILSVSVSWRSNGNARNERRPPISRAVLVYHTVFEVLWIQYRIKSSNKWPLHVNF